MESTCNFEDETEIQNFFANKNVFLTGGSGFLGKVFIEKILRCTNVKCIYILLRPKKNKELKERLNIIFQDAIFEKLLEMKPNAMERMSIILGDCMESNLGISQDDLDVLTENVHIVIHSAATVRFTEPLRRAFTINTRSTMDLLEIAKSMRKLEAFVHVSSAYANVTQTHIGERYYLRDLPYNAERVSEILKSVQLDDSSFCELWKKYPNTYCFTKALAEYAVLKQGHTLPICIFRPAIVTPTYNEPIVGWTDNYNGLTYVLSGIAHGLMHVIRLDLDDEHLVGMVPVDYCANMMAACAWHTAQTAHNSSKSEPIIYNFTPERTNYLNWKDTGKLLKKYGSNMPLANMLWYPNLTAVTSKGMFSVLNFLYHTLPAHACDILFGLLGKKQIVKDQSKRMQRYISIVDKFITTPWTFDTDNTRQLWTSLSKSDQKLFPFDMCPVDWNKYFSEGLLGLRKYLFKDPPETIPESVKQFHRLRTVHQLTKLLIYGFVACILYWIFKHFI